MINKHLLANKKNFLVFKTKQTLSKTCDKNFNNLIVGAAGMSQITTDY